MMKFSKLLLACLVAFGMCACSSEKEDGPDQPENTSDLVYMNIRLSMPNTRSATDGVGDTNSDANPDSEVGLERENAVTSVLIALTDADLNVAAAQKVGNLGAISAQQVYTVTFPADDLLKITPNAPLKVVAFCNPNNDVISKVVKGANIKDIAYTSAAAEGAEIWAESNFLMTNADLSTSVTVPEDWKPYYSVSNPFNLGTVNVERSAARFDYKAVNTDNTYQIVNDKTGTDDSRLKVQLTDVALINESKSFYYLRRVSVTGQNDNAVVGGTETISNYVVDTDAASKNNWTKATNLTGNFWYNLTTPAAWVWTSLSAITKDDNWKGTDGNDGYKVWRYAYENTIPAGTSNQKNGITTGVVFKGNLLVNDPSIDTSKPIFVFQNVVYGNWSQVETAAKKANAMPALAVAYEKANKENDKNDGLGAVGKYGFTRYMPDDDGNYPMVYYYWNRHNDNGKPTEMGPMEFCVVRNNVYKLAVTKINYFGHPVPGVDPNPDPDPDPVDPDDPDEETNVYFNVSVKVLPWVVRVNNIEF